MPYLALQSMIDYDNRAGLGHYSRSHWLAGYDDELIDTLVGKFEQASSPLAHLITARMGGADDGRHFHVDVSRARPGPRVNMTPVAPVLSAPVTRRDRGARLNFVAHPPDDRALTEIWPRITAGPSRAGAVAYTPPGTGGYRVSLPRRRVRQPG
jgi:hypothetical protein